jgi:hypothetical protein
VPGSRIGAVEQATNSTEATAEATNDLILRPGIFIDFLLLHRAVGSSAVGDWGTEAQETSSNSPADKVASRRLA